MNKNVTKSEPMMCTHMNGARNSITDVSEEKEDDSPNYHKEEERFKRIIIQ